MSVAATIFWSGFVFVAYTFAGYPLVIHWLSRLRPASGRSMPAPTPAVQSSPAQFSSAQSSPAQSSPAQSSPAQSWPAVTVVIAVHNEERRVVDKIRNLRALDYPSEKLEVIFVSDGSTDRTDVLIAQEPGVRLLSYPARQGKPYALNLALSRVSTPIVVFADVRQDIAPDAVRHLVAGLSQPGVGAVSGELTHRLSSSQEAAHVGLYWRYERWIRHSESRYFSTVGVTGALYAIRREDYSPIPADTLLDDFEIPARILRSGKRAVLEGRARIYDELQRDSAGERRRKVRTLTGNFQAFSRNGWLFSPKANPVFVQFLSHKVFRLFVPYALASMLVTSFLAEGVFYQVAAFLQIAAYSCPWLCMAIPRLRRTRIVSFIVVFIELNWASVLALRNFLIGRLDVRWEKT